MFFVWSLRAAEKQVNGAFLGTTPDGYLKIAILMANCNYRLAMVRRRQIRYHSEAHPSSLIVSRHTGIARTSVYFHSDVGKFAKCFQQGFVVFRRLGKMGNQRNDGRIIGRSDFPDVDVGDPIIASLNRMCGASKKRCMDSNPINSATTASAMALAKPPSTLTLPVPKVNARLWAFFLE